MFANMPLRRSPVAATRRRGPKCDCGGGGGGGGGGSVVSNESRRISLPL